VINGGEPCDDGNFVEGDGGLVGLLMLVLRRRRRQVDSQTY
jgi:hypothetical protein